MNSSRDANAICQIRPCSPFTGVSKEVFVSHVVGAAHSEVTLIVDHANDVRTLAEEDHDEVDAKASPRAQISERLFSDDSDTKKTENNKKTNSSAPAREEENPLEQIIQAFSCGNNTGVETDR